MIIFLSIVTVMLTVMLSFTIYYLLRFAKIIIVFEDDLSDILNDLNAMDDALDSYMKLPLVTDSPEANSELMNISASVRYARLTVQRMIQRFTARSKQSYETLVYNDVEIEPEAEEEIVMPGQPPGTPNPMSIINKNLGLYVNRRR